MRTYRIQHDWLFSDDELVYPEAEVETLNDKFNSRKAVPVKLSFLLSDDGHLYFDHFSQRERWILLLDDIGEEGNTVISSYKKLLVRALILRFRRKGVHCIVK